MIGVDFILVSWTIDCALCLDVHVSKDGVVLMFHDPGTYAFGGEKTESFHDEGRPYTDDKFDG